MAGVPRPTTPGRRPPSPPFQVPRGPPLKTATIRSVPDNSARRRSFVTALTAAEACGSGIRPSRPTTMPRLRCFLLWTRGTSPMPGSQSATTRRKEVLPKSRTATLTSRRYLWRLNGGRSSSERRVNNSRRLPYVKKVSGLDQLRATHDHVAEVLRARDFIRRLEGRLGDQQDPLHDGAVAHVKDPRRTLGCLGER